MIVECLALNKTSMLSYPKLGEYHRRGKDRIEDVQQQDIIFMKSFVTPSTSKIAVINIPDEWRRSTEGPTLSE